MLEYYAVDLKKPFDMAKFIAKRDLGNDWGFAHENLREKERKQVESSKNNNVLISEEYALVYIKTLEGWKLIRENKIPQCKEFIKSFNFTSDQYKSKKEENFLVVRGTYELVNYQDCPGVTYWDEVRYKGRIKSIVLNVKVNKPTKRYIKEILNL